ncbi:hypothetical protein OG799_17165 [Micromonospora sp. NBC_00898]|nr:hypothetical protein OG799_17165 [Micromonospora sp. NBC_00898]
MTGQLATLDAHLSGPAAALLPDRREAGPSRERRDLSTPVLPAGSFRP